MNAAQLDPGLPPGTVLAGRFRIERMLGRGGMGAVYGALHLELGQYFAIKILQGEAARDPDSIARFKQEAQIASRLTGPNVVRVHDLGQTDVGEPFIVMELLTGRDLDSVVMDPRPVPVADAVNLVCQASLGVATAHAAGLVHRDLKPANLFLSRQVDGSEIVKVLDFGLSKILAAGNVGLTQSTSSFGTPQYMAPEQIMSAKHVDARCDQHALGMILYELLAKKPPFEADNPAALTVKIVTQKAPSVRLMRPDVPTKLDDAIQRALAKKPGDRFGDIGGFVQAIAPFGGRPASDAADTISRGLRASQVQMPMPDASGAVPGADIPSLSAAPTEGSFSRRNIRRGKGSPALFWALVAMVVTLAAAATALLYVIRLKSNASRAVSTEVAKGGSDIAPDSTHVAAPANTVTPNDTVVPIISPASTHDVNSTSASAKPSQPTQSAPTHTSTPRSTETPPTKPPTPRPASSNPFKVF